MKATWRSVISLLLVFIFVIQLMPLSSFATEVENTINPEEVDVTETSNQANIVSEASSVDSYIVGEDENLRDESVKHFRMNDGTFMAVDYGVPVHYQESDGKWEDIDNTLRRVGTEYISVNGDMKKIFSASLANGQLFEMEYQNYKVGMSLVTDEKSLSGVLDEDALDSSSSAAADELADRNDEIDIENSTDVANPEGSDPQNHLSESAVLVEEETLENTASESGGSSISPEGAIIETVPAELTKDGTLYSRVQSANVIASIENPVIAERIAGKTSNEEMIALEKQISEVRYENALRSTDLVYSNYGYNLKESIMIHEKQDSYIYSFSLSLSGLTPKLQEDGTVWLENNNKELVFEIPAPYMFDANGQASNQVFYSLKETDSGYVLTVAADPDWINDRNRAFPVTIDPTIIKHNDGSVLTTMIRSSAPTSPASNYADLFCGLYNNSNYGTCEIVLQVESMPTLPNNCVVVNAAVMMAHAGFFTSDYGNATSGSLTIQIKKLNSTSNNVTGLTYNTVHNSLGIDSTVLDYKVLSNSTRNTYVSWDVTSAALNWISAGATKGAFVLVPSNHTTQQRFCNLIGHAWGDNSPYFAVQYRNTVGIEDYYTYTEASVGRAGHVYFEDFSNKMTIERQDVTLSLAPLDVSITHYFNSGYSGNYFSNGFAAVNTCNYSNMILGDGWKLSIQQTIVPRTVGKDTYLVYTDGDGTQHYFAKESDSSTTYKDEDGLGLTITKTTSGGNTIYTMKDTDVYNTWVFHNGYLISQTDHNGNAVYIAYNNNYSTSGTSWKPSASGSNRIVQVVQHTNSSSAPNITVAAFTYNSSNYLTKITDYANRSTTFSYSGTHLTTITDPDGNSSVYEYASNSNLIGAYDSEAKFGLEFTYRYSELYGFTNRTIDKVSEYSDQSGSRIYGNQFHMFRNGNQLTSARYYGADHTANTSDDLVVYNAFDYYGRTITSYTTDYQKEKMLGVTAGSYKPNSTSNPEANNRLSKTASSGQHVENLILDSGLEHNLVDSGWTRNCYTSVVGDANSVVAEHYSYYYDHDGPYAHEVYPHTGLLQLKTFLGGSTSVGDGYSYLTQDISLTKNKTYTFSAYVNTCTMTSFNPDNKSHGCYIAFLNSSNNSVIKRSEVVNYFTVSSVADGWERISVSYTPTTTGTYTLAVCQVGATGIAVFDDVQLELGDTMSSVNLIQDGGFERVAQANTTYWQSRTRVKHSSISGDGLLGGRTWAIKITGSLTSNKTISQTVNIEKNSDTAFLLSGWGKADSVFFAAKDEGTAYTRFFGLIATITYSDNTTEKHYVPFSPTYSDWQYTSGVVVPKQENKTISTITVSCAYNKNANTAYFDNISLIQEPAQTYSYDSKGNPIAATADKAKSAYEYFSGTSKLKSYTTPSGNKYTLTYKSGTNNVETETLNGVTTTTAYNTSGSVLQTTTRKGSSGNFLKESNVYDAAQNHLTSKNDINGVASSYNYSGTTHLISNSKVGALPIQYYSYNTNNNRMSQTYYSGYDSIQYAYSKGRLSSLIRKAFTSVGGETAFWQKYALAYDAFGNNTYVSVSGSTDGSTYSSAKKLVGYTYESTVSETAVNNGRLQSMTFANGDTKSFSYDIFDRLTAESYNNGVTYHYNYDSEGSLAKQYATNDSGSITESYTYDYDSLGRLIHSKKSNGDTASIRTEHLYDTSNRLTAQNWLFSNGTNVSQTYTYSNGSSGNGTLKKISSKVAVGTSSYSPIITFAYNDILQPTRKTTGSAFYRAYAYKAGSTSNQITSQVEWMNYRKPADDTLILGYKYAYNSSGNISAIYPTLAAGGASSTANQTYTYDALGQLKKVVDNAAGYTYNYTYDTAGNIRTLKSTPTGGTATTTTLTYGSSYWKDRLTKVSVGGTTESITYETPISGYFSGNPISYFNGRHYDFTWVQGRQLASAVVGGVTTNYTYDMAGVRSSKKVGSTTYKYDTLSGLVVHQSWGSKNLYFVYDDNNQPFTLIYHNTSTGSVSRYYYLLNLQGDVVGLINSSGVIKALYQYDPWGGVTVLNPDGTPNTTSSFIGNLNPLRYRGYYYDADTGLYYLQSRYYDPAIGRFINADTFATTDAEGFLSCNMFAYCENNPVNGEDPTGEVVHLLIGALVGVGLEYASYKLIPGSQRPTLADFVGAAISGAISATGIGIVGSIFANAAISSTVYLANCDIQGQKVDMKAWGKTALIGAASGAIGGRGTNGKKLIGVVKKSNTVLKTAVSPKRIAMYASKKTTAYRTAVTSVARTATSFAFVHSKRIWGDTK